MKYIFPIVLFLISCSHKQYPELEVINATFMDMVGTHYYNTPLPPPPYKPVHPDSIYNEIEDEIEFSIELEGTELFQFDSASTTKRHKDQYDSLLTAFTQFDWEQYKQDTLQWEKDSKNRAKDSRNLILLANDSLLAPTTGFVDLSGQLTHSGFKDNFALDSSWLPLILKFTRSILEKEPFDANALTNTGEYSIRGIDYQPSEDDRIVATIAFSRVVFNEDQGRACYYYQEICGRLCGYGYLVFAEREDGRWKIKGVKELWVS